MSASGRAAVLLSLATLTVLVLLVPFRAPLDRVWADEGTYLAMTESLVEDGDLRFDERDRERLEEARGGAATVILQQSEEGVAYSKPILLAVVSAPFYRLLGDWGLPLANALALGVALLLAYAYLLRLGTAGRAGLTLATFAGASVLLPYVTWRMSDILQAALALAGLVLSFAAARTEGEGEAPAAPLQRLLSWRGAPYLGAALLGLLVSMRVSNALVALAPPLAALLGRRPRRALALGLATAAPLALVLAVSALATGAANPYRAVRTSFTAETGYPASSSAAEAGRFAGDPATHQIGVRPRSDPRRVALSTLYFFVGRHTGLLFYFPAAVVLLLAALRRPDAVGTSLLLAFAGTVIFFLGWYPWNYFGGETFLGNRYLLTVYPALLVALRRLPHPAVLGVAWCLATVAYGSAAVSAVRSHDLDRSSQNHTNAGIFRLLPYESTATTLTVGRDLYWAGHLVCFLDPFAKTREWSFELRSDRPPAEIMMAEWRPLETLRLEVSVDAAEATLVFEDYGRKRRFPVGSRLGPSQRVQLPLSPAWRRHLFWWNWEVEYDVRIFRLRLDTPDGGVANATLRYLGDPALGPESAALELLEAEVPEEGGAGSVVPVRLRLRNTSSRIWEAEDVLPVELQAAFHKGRSPEPRFRPEPVPLPVRVSPGEEVELAWELPLPPEAGAYRLRLDLALAGEGPFAAWRGEPVHERRVLVRRRR